MRIRAPRPFQVANTCFGMAAGAASLAAYRGTFTAPERIAFFASSAAGCLALLVLFAEVGWKIVRARHEIRNFDRLWDETRRLRGESAAMTEMTDTEKEEQRRSFAYGNVALSNPDVTRETIDRAAGEIAPCPACCGGWRCVVAVADHTGGRHRDEFGATWTDAEADRADHVPVALLPDRPDSLCYCGRRFDQHHGFEGHRPSAVRA